MYGEYEGPLKIANGKGITEPFIDYSNNLLLQAAMFDNWPLEHVVNMRSSSAKYQTQRMCLQSSYSAFSILVIRAVKVYTKIALPSFEN